MPAQAKKRGNQMEPFQLVERKRKLNHKQGVGESLTDIRGDVVKTVRKKVEWGRIGVGG